MEGGETSQRGASWIRLWGEEGKDGQYFKIFSQMGGKHIPDRNCLLVRFLFFFSNFLTDFDIQVQSLLADLLQGLTKSWPKYCVGFDEI